MSISFPLCLSGLLGLITLLPGGLRAQTAPASPAAHPFAAKFQPFVDDHVLAGAVCLVATKDKILDEETIGFADLETKKPISADAEFWIASMTKPFTSTALMMLVDEGKVKIDDPVEKYLPEFKGLVVKNPNGGPPIPVDHPILIREILSHTSGMANLPYKPPGVSLAEHVQNYPKSPLENQPSTKFVYVNAGINTVGRIIEVVSGMPYERFLQERIFTPLGMKDTTFSPGPEQLARLAFSYKEAPDKQGLVKVDAPLTPLPGKPKPDLLPAGGLFSDAADLLKFCRMMLQGGVFEGKRYISEASLAAMTKIYTTPATGGSYGLGWMVNGRGFFHDGAFKTRMAILPKEGLVEIFLVQQCEPIPDRVKQSMNMFSDTAEAAFGKASTAGGLAPMGVR